MRGWLMVPMLAAGMGIVSCGGHTTVVAPVPEPGAALVGNWHLLGRYGVLAFPRSSMVIEASGNQVTAEGFLSAVCPVSSPFSASGIGISLSLSGTIAKDGSFTLQGVGAGTDSVVLTGTVPVSDSAGWSGSYEAKLTGTPDCAIDDKETFTATRLPALNGTYTGKLTGTGTANDTVQISTAVTQGAPTVQTLPSGKSADVIPLSATISLTGTSCFTSGATPAPNLPASVAGSVSGDTFGLTYRMDDGSQLLVHGWYVDGTGKTLGFEALVVQGPCKGDFWTGNVVAN